MWGGKKPQQHLFCNSSFFCSYCLQLYFSLMLSDTHSLTHKFSFSLHPSLMKQWTPGKFLRTSYALGTFNFKPTTNKFTMVFRLWNCFPFFWKSSFTDPKFYFKSYIYSSQFYFTSYLSYITRAYQELDFCKPHTEIVLSYIADSQH